MSFTENVKTKFTLVTLKRHLSIGIRCVHWHRKSST